MIQPQSAEKFARRDAEVALHAAGKVLPAVAAQAHHRVGGRGEIFILAHFPAQSVQPFRTGGRGGWFAQKHAEQLAQQLAQRQLNRRADRVAPRVEALVSVQCPGGVDGHRERKRVVQAFERQREIRGVLQKAFKMRFGEGDVHQRRAVPRVERVGILRAREEQVARRQQDGLAADEMRDSAGGDERNFVMRVVVHRAGEAAAQEGVAIALAFRGRNRARVGFLGERTGSFAGQQRGAHKRILL